jgi:biopolymer transport protein ExbB/TolQ
MMTKSVFGFAIRVLGLALVLSGLAGSVHAGFPAVSAPEIDPASAAAAVGLVLGGAAMLGHRRRK